MFKNYLDVALRSFLGNKLFSFINVFGLAVGLASVILIGLYVADELSYDRYHPDAERLYRISRDFYAFSDSPEMFLAPNAPQAAALLKADFPEIESVARLYGGRVLLGRDEADVAFYDDAVQFVDPAFLHMFAFDWIAGEPITALDQPNSIVLTASAARRLFGNGDPVGQVVKMENVIPLNVTGVIRDLPANTHLSASVFVSLETIFLMFGEEARGNWGTNAYHTYVKLAPGADIAQVEAGLPAFMNRHLNERASTSTGMSAMPVTDIHLHSTRQLEMKAPGSITTVLSLTAIAFGILVIACFNFMNLSTARSAMRGKEVGVRKTIGAERKHLVLQFLGESVGLTLLATLIAIVIVEIALPAFNGFVGKNLEFSVLSDARLQLALLGLVLVVGCLAGSYPALHLSGFKAAQVLKSRASTGVGDILFRNLLVVLQFSISIALVIATSVVMLQTRYARNFDPGFQKDRVVVLTGPPSQGVTPNWPVLRNELLRHPEISAVSASNLVPGDENLNTMTVRIGGSDDVRDMAYLMVDYGFFETFGVPLLAGRNFSEAFPNDRIALPSPGNLEQTGNFILNASAAREYGWTPDEALDKEFQLFSGGGVVLRGRIAGVVADSNFESVRFGVKPLIFILTAQGPWMNQFQALASASVRISGRDVQGTLDYIDQTWKRVIPQFPIIRSFLSDNFAALYQQDTRLGQMFSSFAALAILIACLGLFGLGTFNAQRRIKEIGVRKVMGGSVWSIVWLLTSSFSKLVLLSNLIAWPLAYIAMERWLQNFAYRIDLTPLVFIGSGLIALCIAWVTVGGTAAKAAAQKPVLALRYE